MQLPLATAALLAIATAAQAQRCAATTRVFFEFEVERPARYVGDSAVTPRPASRPLRLARQERDARDTLLVQVVVDTLGGAEPGTLKVLRAPGGERYQPALLRVMPRWRFTPARVGGCKVRQLFQTAVSP